ncbi:hypothetical protein [Prauserella aidingensis]|uniref:hypothetical protein n=1 Tax=Prauserella aidingensis TaxID=387890 RepID=UPI0020A28AEB|nr:hypothetical protein [Prauserella aidingensis]
MVALRTGQHRDFGPTPAIRVGTVAHAGAAAHAGDPASALWPTPAPWRAWAPVVPAACRVRSSFLVDLDERPGGDDGRQDDDRDDQNLENHGRLLVVEAPVKA